MKIQLNSVVVDDQDKALKFYTEGWTFIKSKDIPIGADKWLTVISPEGPKDVELLLEPNSNPATKTCQTALFDQGIRLTAFAVDDFQSESERMKGLGVEFTMEQTSVGPTTIAVFNDTCGNLIQIYQVTGG